MLKRKKALLLSVLPFAIALGLKFIFEGLILYPSSSDVGATVAGQFPLMLENMKLYLENMQLWLADFPLVPGSISLVLRLMLVGFLGLFILGSLLSFRKNAHYLVLILGTFAILINLRYDQGVRYFFPVLPLMLMLAFTGLAWLWSKLNVRLKFRPGKKLCLAADAVLLALCLLAVVQTGAAGSAIRQAEPLGAYSGDAVEMYNYIRSSTEPDSVIAFIKPRFLYLNTERPSFVPMINGHGIELADYYLCDTYYSTGEYEALLDAGTAFEELYSTPSLVLYKVN